MKWLQTLQRHLPKHKYAIDAKQLGDHAVLAWSNLGYWDKATDPLILRLAKHWQRILLIDYS